MRTSWQGMIGAAVLTSVLCAPVTQASAQGTQQPPPSPRPAAPLPPLPATQIDDRLPALKQTFSLSFAQPQPIRDVLLLMLKDTGLGIVIDPDVTGTFTGELAGVTLKQALDLALQPLSLEYAIDNRVLHVFRRPTDTRFFTVNRVVTRRSSERTTGTTASGAAVTASDATDFYDEIGRSIGPMLSRDGTFTVDRKSGLVRVTDYPERLDRVARYLELAELRATRQVQIRATFIEVTLRDARSAGIDWRAVLAAAGEAVTTRAERGIGAPASERAGGVGGAKPPDEVTSPLIVRRFDALLRALATQGTVNVAASPAVTTLNNEPALVRIAAATADGVALAVTPQVSADGVIEMDVAPAATMGGAETLVRIRDGETVVLGGLAPHGKTEILILLTPTII